tara:strand:- start:314 stop:547 length:234 start_codon:yes stop_codon:yes gene_type:complete
MGLSGQMGALNVASGSAYWPPGEEERYRERLQLEHQLQKIKDELRALMVQIERLQSELREVPWPHAVARPGGGAIYR